MSPLPNEYDLKGLPCTETLEHDISYILFVSILPILS